MSGRKIEKCPHCRVVTVVSKFVFVLGTILRLDSKLNEIDTQIPKKNVILCLI